jgi:uncharacterized Tic20 family protein
MSENSAPTYTSEERVMAGLAHISVVMFSWGIIVPVVVWVTEWEKSRFAIFQALQALAYQLLSMLRYMVCAFGIMIPAMGIQFLVFTTPDDPTTAMPLFAFIPLLGMMAVFCFMGLYTLVGIIGGILSFTGKDFRYPLLGTWMERYLSGAITAE